MERELIEEKFKNLETQIIMLAEQIKSWQSTQGNDLSKVIAKVKTLELTYLTRKEVSQMIEDNNKDLHIRKVSSWGINRIANEKLIIGVASFLGITNLIAILLFFFNA